MRELDDDLQIDDDIREIINGTSLPIEENGNKKEHLLDGSDEDKNQDRSADRVVEEFDQKTLMTEFLQAWRNERLAPELLPYEIKLMDKISGLVLQHMAAIEDIRTGNIADENLHLVVHMVDLDLSRCKYVIRDYTKIRLEKIEKYAAHLLESARATGQSNMTALETSHAERFINLWESHMQSQVLAQLPSELGILNESHMVPSPDLSQSVFVYAKNLCGPVYFGNNQSTMLSPGSQYMLQYSVIRELLLNGDVYLI